ncbi:MAG: hypothetical protein HC915_19610 [Anaerolineae bacterium]|nr:hypothetical protein [Anaerolineae bacterium]
MAAFGQKTYLMAEGGGQIVGVIAFLVENLVTRVDEVVIHRGAPQGAVGRALIDAMESASGDLQSEVAFVFLDPTSNPEIKAAFLAAGYEEQKVEDIRIPAWREAVAESKPENTVLLSKRLREKLVLKPI